MPSSIGYLYTLWIAKSVLGSSEIALKIPSTFAMLGAVYFLFRAARELFDVEFAFFSCIFFCLEYNVVFAATDARPYAFTLLASNLAIFAFVRWMTRLRTREGILFGVAAAGILYAHGLSGCSHPSLHGQADNGNGYWIGLRRCSSLHLDVVCSQLWVHGSRTRTSSSASIQQHE